MKLWDQLRRRSVENEPTLDAQQRNGQAATLRPRLRDAAPRQGQAGRQARSLLRPLPLLGALLVVVAFAGYLAVYGQTTQQTAVLVAARDLPPGTVLGPGDLRVGRLAGDAQTMGGLVTKAQLGRVLGRTLRRGLAPGTPLALGALGRQGSQPAAFTLVVPALHALGASLVPGDRVSVLATFASASGQAQTRALARGLEVLAVGQAPAGLGQASATIPVTVALPDPALASELALANSQAKIDLLREGARGGGAPIPTATTAQGG